jgi:hypothetical protein
MSTLIHKATLLLSLRDEKQVIRIPNDDYPLPGIQVSVDPSQPLTPQLKKQAAQYLGQDVTEQLEVVIGLEPLLKLDSHETSKLFVIRLKEGVFQVPAEWPTIATLLRSLPQGSNRVAYNKALQVLAGTLEHDFEVLEADEQVQRRLKDLNTSED